MSLEIRIFSTTQKLPIMTETTRYTTLALYYLNLLFDAALLMLFSLAVFDDVFGLQFRTS